MLGLEPSIWPEVLLGRSQSLTNLDTGGELSVKAQK